jgi:hypothetical protein
VPRTVFFSWQIDTEKRGGRNVIEWALEKACRRISADTSVEETDRDRKLKVDSNTKGVAGSPPIVDTIFRKIDGAAVFVPDLTFIGKRPDGRPTPNPNVLVEYGWAKQPWYFTARDGSPALTIAGLWDEWKDEASGETLKSCTMIITEPNKFVAEVHERMPVLLAEKDYVPWLSGKAGIELLKPAAENVVQKWPVSKRVNSSRAPDDDQTLIDKVKT